MITSSISGMFVYAYSRISSSFSQAYHTPFSKEKRWISNKMHRIGIRHDSGPVLILLLQSKMVFRFEAPYFVKFAWLWFSFISLFIALRCIYNMHIESGTYLHCFPNGFHSPSTSTKMKTSTPCWQCCQYRSKRKKNERCLEHKISSNRQKRKMFVAFSVGFQWMCLFPPVQNILLRWMELVYVLIMCWTGNLLFSLCVGSSLYCDSE